ncbi:FecR family protein [Runella sp. MFBS21]|uniref:FecR family protein n=1 Tax=Runella sp. MFBS21 TaxID=3034018 RepID=UPI0023F98E78|nr:FecR family protein [Runella sp. MFBS21]MDF7819286.1 FecR family protein [Runella sp. MFBS21]
MTRQEFDILAEKYIAGECTPEEAALLERWAALHYKRHNESPFFKESQEVANNETRIWAGIQAEIGSEKEKPVRPIWLVWSSIAACLLMVLGGGWYFFYKESFRKISESSPVGIESKNTTLSHQLIILPDSSLVTLEAGASIVASENYGKQTRVVYLTGEAFFEVRPNPQLPFLVYTGELITEVLGTSFRIKPEEKLKTIEVSVTTGKVSIYTGNDRLEKKRNGVIATANQKVVFDTELQTIRQGLVDIPKIIALPPTKSPFLFDDTPVEDILALMQKVYGVEIMVGNPTLKKCVFTGDLNGLDLYEQLDYMCEVLRVTYEIRGTSIFISGSGCG